MKKLLLCFMFLGARAFADAPEKNFYEFLSRTLMKSGERQKETPSLLAKKDEKKKLDLNVHGVKEVEQKVIFSELLGQLHPEEKESSVLSFQAIDQLDLINVTAEKASLAKQLATYTLFGEVVMAKDLSQPLIDISAIQERQKAIKALADNPELCAQLSKAFADIKRGQDMLFTFFDTSNILTEEVLKPIYGWGSGKNATTLYTVRGLKNIYATFCLSTVYYQLSLQKNLLEKGPRPGATTFEKIGHYACVPFTSYYDTVKMIGVLHDPRFYLKLCRGEGFSDLINIVLHDPNDVRLNFDEALLTADQKQQLSSQGKKIAAGVAVGTGVFDALSVYVIYNVIQMLKQDHAILTNMQTRLMGAASVVRGLQAIELILQKHPELAQTAPTLKKISALFATSGEVGKLLRLLQTNTFAGDPSFFSNGVHIMVAYKLMGEHKNSLCPALEAAGELDVYATMAHCLSSPERGVYSLVEFVESDRPVVRLDDFWNPLMAPAQAVANSVFFGAGHDSNVLITGPNGSGKSTNMKAVAYNVLLAQVFGVAAARFAQIAPFHHFNVYLNVQENIQAGKSSFMAEAELLNEICAKVAASAITERSFTIVDEGLRGTVAQEAETRLTKAIESLVMVPQDLCIFATHFEQPTTLETKLTGKITNYYVGLEEPTRGAFVRTFKLVRGVNHWWFADPDKRKRFVDWLVIK